MVGDGGAEFADALAAAEAELERWLAEEATANPVVDEVVRDREHPRRWFLRVLGEEKDVYTIWLRLEQRTLSYETFVMPAPEENAAAFYEYLLRKNNKMYGVGYSIGEEDALFLGGQLDIGYVSSAELDRILGSLYAYVEETFRPALRLGFASRFGG